MNPISVLLLDTEPSTQNHYIALSIADALRRHPAVSRVVLADHRNALAQMGEDRFDVFIAFGGSRPHTALLTRLARLASRSVLWTTEDPYELASNISLSTAFDAVFTNDRSCVTAYGGRAQHLPLAASTQLQDLPVQVHDELYRYDLLFIGTAWPNRVKTLNAIIDALPTARLKLALPWNEFIGKPVLSRADLITDWRCSNRDFARLANQSRIVLTLPRNFSAADMAQAAGTTPPPRLFETALAGGFQIVVGADDEVTDYYEDGTEICICDDDDAATGAIIQALAAPDTRINAAQRARARTLREHLYDHRVAQLIGHVVQLDRRPEPPRLGRRTILVVSHNRAGFQAGGGIEVYQEQLTALAPEFDFLFLFPTLHGEIWNLRLQGAGVDREFPWGYGSGPLLTDPLAESIFERILFEYRIDLVHFHHLLHFPLSLPLIARACGLPVIYQLHDHFLICERWLLLDRNGRFCDVVHRGRDQCDACMIAGSNYPAGSKARRDNFMEKVVEAVDAFVTSTPATGAYLRAFYPMIKAEQIVEIEMLNPVVSSTQENSERARRSNNQSHLTVAVVGGLYAHKGGDDLIDLMRLCEGQAIRFEVFGRLDPHYAGRILGLPPGLVRTHGPYEQSAIVALLGGCDVSLHLSTWPETYVLALSEAWQAGLVPIVCDIGALAERVTDGVDGFIVRPHHPGGVMERLLELAFDTERLESMRTTIRAKRVASPPQHLAQMRDLYRSLIAARPCPHDHVPDRVSGPFDLRLRDLGLRVNSAHWFDRTIEWDPGVHGGQDATLTGPEIELQDDLEEVHRALPLQPVRLTDSRTTWSLDAIAVDGRPLSARSGREVVLQHLALKGWLRDARWPTPQQSYLRIVGSGHARYAQLNELQRDDLVSLFSDAGAGKAGFGGRISVAALETGFYRVDLIQATSDCLLVAPGLLQIFVMDVDTAERGVWRERPHRPPAHQRIAISELRQNLAELDGVLIAAADADWALHASLTEAPQDQPVNSVVLRASEAGPTYTLEPHVEAAEPSKAPASAIGFVASLSGVRPGFYAVEIAAGNALYLDTGLKLRIAQGSDPFYFSDQAPSAIRHWTGRRWVRRAPVLEKIERLLDVSTADGDEMIRCRGWAYVRGLGRPLGTLARWEEGGKARYCIGAPIARPEIATRLEQPDAVDCGFSLALPAASLRKGTVRFYQIYDRRTVVFTGFSRELTRRCAPEIMRGAE